MSLLTKQVALPAFFKKLGRRTKPCLGIDAGVWAVKMVRHLPGEGLRFEKCCLVRANGLSDGQVKAALDAGKLGRDSAAFSIADEKVESHEFHLPRLEKSELQTAIDFEIKKTASTDFVFHDVLTFPNPQGFEIQCVMAAKDIVQGRFDEGKALGVIPEFLETESSALLTCLQALSAGAAVDRAAIVDLGYTSFRLIFIHQDRVSFTRSLYFGLSSVCQQAATGLNVTPEALHPILPQLKGEVGAAAGSPLAAGLERYVQEALYTLCEEFRRSEFFGRDQKGLEDIEQVFLCGGGACVPAAVDYLRHHLAEKKVETLDPFRMLDARKPEGVEEGSGPLWACAVGLSLRDREGRTS